MTGTGNDVGGPIGASFAAISGASASGSVSGQDHTGGLIGFNAAAVTNSTASGTVDGASYVGGLVGLNCAAVTGSHSTGAVGGTRYVGGLVGWNTTYGSVAGFDAAGAVGGSGDDVGGLVGVNQNTVTNSRALASVTVTGGLNVGGLVGLSQGSVDGASASNGVTGDVGVGGLVGWNDTGATISKSYATGAVTGRPGGADPNSHDDYVGGLVGVNFGTTSDVYATGAASGTQVVGGLVGTNMPQGTVTNAYAFGPVTASLTAGGGVFGVNAGTVSSTYWQPSTAGQAYDTGYRTPGAQGTATAIGPGVACAPGASCHPNAQATYAGFDFTGTWVANSAAPPTLRGARTQ